MNNAPDFIQIPNQVFMDRELSGIDMLTYGLVYWYTKLKNEKCYASNKTFADILGVQPRKVSEALNRLQKQGYIDVLYKDTKKRNREEIIPLVMYRTIVRTDIPDSPNGHTSDSPNGLQKKNNIIRKEKNTNTETSSVEVSELIKSFEKINPASKKFYGNTTQRKACDFLIKEYSFNRVKIVVEKTLPKTNTMAFFPTIVTPLQLQEKWSILESAILKHKSKSDAEKNKQGVCL